MAGFLFRWSDLEILDDPMPETMYCRGVRRWKNSSSTSEIEGGGGEEQVEERKMEGSKSTVNHMYSLQSFIGPNVYVQQYTTTTSVLNLSNLGTNGTEESSF